MYELLKQLCKLNGVSGDEDVVRDYIRQQVKPYADTIRTDLLGNLIVTKRGANTGGPHLLLAAHMDEVGLIVTKITNEGFLKFSFMGGVDRRVVLGKRVVLGSGKIKGVIGIKAVHLFTREEEKKVPAGDELYIDIGAASKEEAEKMVSVGTYGYFVCPPEHFGDGMMKAKAIDDRVGCAVMIKLLAEELPVDVTFVFTTQEEVGSCGAFGAAYGTNADAVLILEGTTAADLAEMPGHKQVCALGKGPVLMRMDRSSIYDWALFDQLRALAEENHIPWQTKEYIAGGNDGASFQHSKGGTRVAAIAAPVRYLHAPSSVGKLSDFEDMLRLTRLLLQNAEKFFHKEEEKNGAI